MTLLDLGLVAAGRTNAAISRDGRSPLRVTALIVALVLLTVLPLVAISLVSIPSEKSFADIQDRRYRDLSWLRLEGDLRAAGQATDGRYLYTLHDPADESLAITVYAPQPLPTGETQVTGQVRTAKRLPGTFDSFYADALTEPARHDPWLLIATPALMAGFLVVGRRVGYPVIRREDRSPRGQPRQLAAGETIAARWSGRLDQEEQPLDTPQACTVAVDGDGEACSVTVVHAGGTRSFAVRRSSPKPIGRVCRVRGCTPHLEIHAPGADAVFEFDSPGDRDRFAAALS